MLIRFNHLETMRAQRHPEATGTQTMKLMTFGQRANYARRILARLTQQQLRDKMEELTGGSVSVGRNYISQIETDDANPVFEVVAAMARALGVSLDFLAGFTEDYTPVAPGSEPAPHYYSAEADEVAQLVDAMHPSQREVILNVAKNILLAPSPRQQDRAEMRDILDSVERDHGRTVRLQVEKLMRDKGFPMDTAA